MPRETNRLPFRADGQRRPKGAFIGKSSEREVQAKGTAGTKALR